MFYNIIVILIKFCAPVSLNCNNRIIILGMENFKSSIRMISLY